MTRLRLRRIFWMGAAAIVVAAALVALAAVVKGDFSDTDGRILITLAALVLAVGPLIAGLVLVERDHAPQVTARLPAESESLQSLA